VANAILLRLLVAAVLVVPGWFLMAQMSGGSDGPPPPGSRGAQAAELGSNAALVQAAQVMGAHHQTYGTFAGAELSSVPGTRLVRADTTTFCAEAGEAGWLYHLDGSATQDNSWNWGAVKGPCPPA
jgi:hypothetical protein